MMKRHAGREAVALVFLLLSTQASAQFLPKFGARAMGMGGSYTALADDATALVWNPASVAFAGRGAFAATGAIDVDDRGDFIDEVVELADLDFSDPNIIQIISDATRAVEILVDMERNFEGATGTTYLGFFATGSSYGFSIVESAQAFVAPQVDRVHIQPTLDPEDSLIFNESSVRFEALRMREYVLTLGAPLADNSLAVGVNLRYLRGATYFIDKRFTELEGLSASDLVDEATKENKFKENHFCYDAGVLLTASPRVRLGLAVRNLNNPTFSLANADESFKLQRRTRAGIAVFPNKSLTIAADMDLDKSPTGVPEIMQREISAGFEKYFSKKRAALRGGAVFHVGDGENDSTLFGGFGAGSARAFFDAALGLSPSSSDLALAFQLTVRR